MHIIADGVQVHAGLGMKGVCQTKGEEDRIWKERRRQSRRVCNKKVIAERMCKLIAINEWIKKQIQKWGFEIENK